MNEMTRGSFLRRLVAGTAMVAVPPAFLSLLETEEEQAPITVAPVGKSYVREWWIESGEDSHIIAQLNDPVRRVYLETHVVAPRSGIYIQFRPGREYPYEGLQLRVKPHPLPEGDGYREMPLRPLGPQNGPVRALIANADGLEVYGGIVTVAR